MHNQLICFNTFITGLRQHECIINCSALRGNKNELPPHPPWGTPYIYEGCTKKRKEKGTKRNGNNKQTCLLFQTKHVKTIIHYTGRMPVNKLKNLPELLRSV